jgi:DNA-binding protein H-NS
MATKKTDTLADIRRQIVELERQAEVARRAEISEVIKGIREAMNVYGLTLADIGLAGRRSVGKGKAKQAGQAMYGDGRGNTWAGRGPRPLWLREAIKAGRPLEQFLLAGKAHPGPKARGSSKKAMYRDADGNVWGGRGPRPLWLREALARGQHLEDFAV